MRGSREWGPDPPPLKISNFLNYIVKLSKKRSWTPLPPGRDRYPSNPPSRKKILDPCMIYLFYVSIDGIFLLVCYIYVINTFVLAYKCSAYIKHFDDPMSIYVNGARPLTGSIEKIFFIVSLELVSDYINLHVCDLLLLLIFIIFIHI